jgi:hypothetical protein
MSLLTVLNGCGLVLASNGIVTSRPWHASDMQKFLDENYPVGTDENKLVTEFTKHGYELRKSDCPSSDCVRYLQVKPKCSWLFGTFEGMEISWQASSDEKIQSIKQRKKMCLYTP